MAVERLVWEIRRAFQDLSAAADRKLERLEIRARDRAFLEFLAREPAPISLSAIAQKYSVSRQHVHQTYHALSHPEWVEEVPDPDDRRAVLLRLSRTGRAMWKRIRTIDETLFSQMGSHLDSAKTVSATSLLQELRQQLAKEVEDA